jgi:hypothetical protein
MERVEEYHRQASSDVLRDESKSEEPKGATDMPKNNSGVESSNEGSNPEVSLIPERTEHNQISMEPQVKATKHDLEQLTAEVYGRHLRDFMRKIYSMEELSYLESKA